MRGIGWKGALVALVAVACEGPAGTERVGGTAAPLMTSTTQLVADDGAADDQLGYGVDLDGDTLIASARGADPAGAAYVFVRDTSGWTQQQKLTGTGAVTEDRFGASVAVSGDWAMVGAPYADDVHANTGKVYVFHRSSGTWTQVDVLEAGTRRLNMQFGTAVTLRGDTAVVGAPEDPISGSASGSVWIFVNDAGTWTQQAELRASDGDAGDEFGASVDIDGDDLIVGARTNEGRWYEIDSGTVYFFERSGTTWTQTQNVRASDSDNYSNFGHSVAISGDTALVGAWLKDSVGYNAGAAYVLERSAGTWSETQRLVPSSVDAYDRFGTDVELEGGTALIGAPNFDEGALSAVGTAFVYLRGSSWFEWDRITGDAADETDRFGWAVAMQGDRVAIGAHGDEAGTADDFVGSLWVHELVRAADGESCSYGPECASGYCVDGVCCDTACGGGAADDCMACATSEGAAADGTCGPLSASVAPTVTCRPAAGLCDVAETCVDGDTACPADAVEPADTVCRASAGDCDLEEVCDGSSAACPADAVEPSTTVCRASAGDCDVEETCDGSGVDCPVDAVEPSTTVCRASAGDCDVEETCDGSGVDCPADAVASDSTVCRASAGACDAAETCDGSTVDCPTDADEPDGTPCADGVTCNGDEVCASGTCVAGTALDCDDDNPCTADMCAEPSGCAHEAITGCCVDDAGCDDGDACTADTCDTGTNTCQREAVTGCEPDAGTPGGDAGAGTDAGRSGTDAGVDAGAPGADAGPGVSTRDRGGCGCRVAGRPPRPAAGWLAALLGLPVAVLVRRRGRRGARA